MRFYKGLGAENVVFRVRTIDEIIAGFQATRRFAMYVLAAFAVLALVLSVVGIYGAVSYVVAATTEISAHGQHHRWRALRTDRRAALRTPSYFDSMLTKALVTSGACSSSPSSLSWSASARQRSSVMQPRHFVLSSPTT